MITEKCPAEPLPSETSMDNDCMHTLKPISTMLFHSVQYIYNQHCPLKAYELVCLNGYWDFQGVPFCTNTLHWCNTILELPLHKV